MVWAGRSGHYPIFPMRRPRNGPAMESDLSSHVPPLPWAPLSAAHKVSSASLLVLVETPLNGNAWGSPVPLDWSVGGGSRGPVSLGGAPLRLSHGKAGHVGTPAVVSVDFPPFCFTPSYLEILCLVESPRKASGDWEI